MMNSQATCETDQIETEKRSCDEHGEYVARVIRTLPGMSPIIENCPECMAKRRAESEAAQKRDALMAHESKIRALFARSGIPARFKDRELSSYRAESEGQKRILTVANKYVERFADRKGTSLVLAGKPGTGKTHIACGIAHALMRNDASAMFATVLQTIRHVKDTYRRDSERTETQAINDLLLPDLLIIDEIGAQIGSEHEKMILFEVINERYQQCRSTILISNLTVDELNGFLGDRVLDRFRECGAILAFDWNSYRWTRHEP